MAGAIAIVVVSAALTRANVASLTGAASDPCAKAAADLASALDFEFGAYNPNVTLKLQCSVATGQTG
ncbi:MAG: hypothetical protein ACRDIA_05605, partial [Actinomycetota bacterium]